MLVQIEPVLKRPTTVARAAIVRHIAYVWFLQCLGRTEGHGVRDILAHSNRRSMRDILAYSNRSSVRLNLDPEKEQVRRSIR